MTNPYLPHPPAVTHNGTDTITGRVVTVELAAQPIIRDLVHALARLVALDDGAAKQLMECGEESLWADEASDRLSRLDFGSPGYLSVSEHYEAAETLAVERAAELADRLGPLTLRLGPDAAHRLAGALARAVTEGLDHAALVAEEQANVEHEVAA